MDPMLRQVRQEKNAVRISVHRPFALSRWKGKRAFFIINLINLLIAAVFVFVSTSGLFAAETLRPVQVGSKKFTENVIIGELLVLLVEREGIPVTYREQLGGTRILWNALRKGDIDVYPEYTGTLAREILGIQKSFTEEEIRRAIAPYGVMMSRGLGFHNSYALGMKESVARQFGISRISDLRRFPGLEFGFTSEFMNRRDGWPGLRAAYRLPQKRVRGMEHELAYIGIEQGSIQVIDLYSTDPEIALYRLRVLQDDLHFFPEYEAVLLYRADLAARRPRGLQAMLGLEGKISGAAMARMNEEAKISQIPTAKIASDFLGKEFGFGIKAEGASRMHDLLIRTGEHLYLVGISLGAAILFSVPLGILAARRSRQGQVILGAAGIIQTIPSLALLVFMIPLLGIGSAPAIVALFLYSLLPIVRNTFLGLSNIPVEIRESAEALGLPGGHRLRRIELPLASPAILSGIKTSAVINVGTATLGALIGAGGYGQPILTGIRLADTALILEGAVPAAALALAVQGLFEIAERFIVPRGLRLKKE